MINAITLNSKPVPLPAVKSPPYLSQLAEEQCTLNHEFLDDAMKRRSFEMEGFPRLSNPLFTRT
jgi:hypothetical protein